MSLEESIKDKLVDKFPFLKDKIRMQRARRIYCETDMTNFYDVFKFAVKELDLSFLITITGLDEGERFGFIYHLAGSGGMIFNLKTYLPKTEAGIKTIIGDFPNAEIYEREIEDLLGVKVEGLPPGKRYPLPDDWPAGQFPLRKDWKVKNA